MRLFMCILLLLCLFASVYAQQFNSNNGGNSLLMTQEEWSTLINADPKTVEARIYDLVIAAENARANGQNAEALQNLQIGLFLEKALRRPTPAALRLNTYVAETMSPVNPEYGLQFFRKAIQIGEALDDKAMFNVYTNTAGCFQELGLFDSAYVYFHRAINEARTDSPMAQVSSFNNIGVFFHQHEQYDSARYYFQMALQELVLSDESTGLYCAIRDNLAQLDILAGNDSPALEIFTFNDSTYAATPRLYFKYLPNKIRLLSTRRRVIPGSITEEIQQTEQFIRDHTFSLKPHDILQFYRYAEDHFTETGERSRMIYYRDMYRTLADSLDRLSVEQLNAITGSLMAAQEASFRNQVAAQMLQTEKVKLRLQSSRRLLLIAMISALVVIGLLVLYFRKRRQELHALRQVAESAAKQKEMEARLIEQELALKKKDITSLVLHNTHVHDANRKVIDRLNTAIGEKDKLEQNIRGLLHELQNQSQMGDRAMTLQSNIDLVNESFYQTLKARFPDLTKAEFELCGYLRINLTNKDIAVLKSIETDSVKMSKNRLRKKLGITQETDLYQFIQQIS